MHMLLFVSMVFMKARESEKMGEREGVSVNVYSKNKFVCVCV